MNDGERLLIFAPIGRDGALIAGLLQGLGGDCRICRDVAELRRGLADGVGVVILTEEVLGQPLGLAEYVAAQPPWSDLPILLLTRKGADSPAVVHAMETLGNVTLLERPVRVGALRSSVRSALRARARQYQTRAHLEDRERADAHKNRFLATLAHELRNPLAPIRNALAILSISDGARAPELGAIMERQLDHMVRLVDDLMEVSRIDRGMIELRRRRVELEAVIAVAVETSRPLIDAAGHELSIDLPAEPLVLDADPVRLAQVFSNLLNNAAKYTDPGGRITLRARREGGDAAITIEDTGVGIEPAELQRVFDMFSQGDPGGERTRSGLGIGLTLARNLVELHGGAVTASSPGRGHGSTFVVRLPLDGASAGVPAPVQVAAAAADPGAAPATTRRILVVDDNHDSADTLGAMLMLLGGDVRVAYDGPAALQAYDEFHPALVVLDLGMPGMDGYEVARRMRQRDDGGNSMLVALTGWGQDSDRESTAQAGFDHHLVKPVGLDAVRTLLSGTRH